jgi:hypothetical protein
VGVEYRAILSGEDSQIEQRIFAARDDGHALTHARQFARDHNVELWQDTRFVFKIECRRRPTDRD